VEHVTRIGEGRFAHKISVANPGRHKPRWGDRPTLKWIFKKQRCEYVDRTHLP